MPKSRKGYGDQVMNESKGITRRTMLAATAAAITAPTILSSVKAAPDPVRLGHIGAGVRGWDLLQHTGSLKSAQVVAVCDVYKPHLERGLKAARNPEAKGYTNYHDLLNDPQVEAVVIATPDHWHEQMVLDAVAAGKAIYCEKGLTTSIAAAKRMRDAVKNSNTVFQLGHQGRQYPSTEEAGRLMREGAIGPVTLVHTGRVFNGTRERAPWRWYGYYNIYDRPDPVQVAKDVDWEAWLGSCPSIDFNEEHFWHWRCYWAYGTGQAGDLLSHELDHVQSVLRWGIPDSCVCSGHNAFYHDGREVPDTWLAQYTFEKEDAMLLFEGCMNSTREQPPEYIGREGRIIFNGIGQDANRFYVYPDAPPYPHLGRELKPKQVFDPAEHENWPTHMEDFLQCVRSGGTPRCNIDEAFIEAATLLMSVEAYHQKRQVRWDAQIEAIV
ncbi:MAG TPA: Gfo/Idh/MocA family oxidoreductase [Candidatus Hydrogenedentes bacterium]|jgi:predicted dehydrogenase|nr:MAG: Inositol 2-dehydrogenase [Candidatus Hydrogenedentes bacterium ADurb.Bin170]HNZ47589.1 Gfo/Idh/MocA family oxidoreductase [Candidatus Hydrogenedentota bacterium]HOD94246.1 Gfo/Idh/MocA family oxidoreductase [Candidatus Hydrogenedentota bacterium]HOM48786.1 Gfo/Idh/MocA family oxidoreductase [Candidatus Hydrogenedentota bacterium]HOR49653.1 Gfo/Idh/MocA family oxidoreductase [Candidatus Hydrogenedentota bacterium]